MLEQLLTQLGVECLPEKLPPQIEVDLSPLEEAGQAIHVKDIALDPDITVTTEPDQIIVKVSRIKVAVEEEEVVTVAEEEVLPAEAETEVVTKVEKPAEEEQ
jgi:large subunit ribosomal protein L25